MDGQQRLSAIYLALQGTYSVKRPYFGWNNDNAFPEKKLFLNLLSDIHTDEDNEFNYSFQFITANESNELTKDKLWLSVRLVLTWSKDSPPIDEYYDEIVAKSIGKVDILDRLNDSQTRNRIKRILRDLHSRLVREELINYFKIEEQELDNILKIFVRVNSGGTILSKTDLLFSTIVANWEDGRDEIEKFITSINKRGDGFNFNNDFVMRCCLMLTDCPVLFKVGSFKTENVVKIKTNWDNIKNAITQTIDLLVDFGLNDSTLPSQNAVIPIAYYSMKGGIINAQTKNELKKYLFHSFLKNIFSGQGDTVLTNLRNSLRQKNGTSDDYSLKNNSFSFNDILTTKFPSNKSLKIADEDINEFLDYKKGNSAFLVLSFLYPNLRYGQVKFHQDHIHPASQFTEAKLNSINIIGASQKFFIDNKDKLPNLQLLEGLENIKKSKTPFKDWLSDKDDKGNLIIQDRNKFLSDNYIDTNQNLDFIDFESFYNLRKSKIETELKRILK